MRQQIRHVINSQFYVSKQGIFALDLSFAVPAESLDDVMPGTRVSLWCYLGAAEPSVDPRQLEEAIQSALLLFGLPDRIDWAATRLRVFRRREAAKLVGKAIARGLRTPRDSAHPISDLG